MAIPTADQIWKDFDPEGNPHEPIKEEIRRYLNFVFALATAAGMKTYPTKAAMDADTTQPDGMPALLYADPVAANNFPTVWVWNDASNIWIAGVDRIAEVKATADDASAKVNPLAAAMTIVPTNIVNFVAGLNLGEVMQRLIASPVYSYFVSNQIDGVFHGARLDGDYEFMGLKFRVVRSPYPIFVTNEQGEPVWMLGDDGFPLGGLTPDQEAEVQTMIDASGGGASDATLTPVYLDAGKLYEVDADGPSLVLDPAPYAFSRSAVRDADRTVTVTNRPFISATETAVAVDQGLGLAVPASPKILNICPGTGQSLLVGFQGNPLTLGLTNPYPEKILKGLGLDVRLGLASDAGTNPVFNPAVLTDFDPLISMTGTGGSAFGVTVFEGMGPGMLAPLDEAIGLTPRHLFMAIGRGGQPYSTIRKGTNCYANIIAAATKACALAVAKGWVPFIPFVTIVHGEADGASLTYYDDLIEWQDDLNTDLKAITGQAADIFFLISQPSAFSAGNHLSGLAMVKAMEDFPDLFTVAAPNYQFRTLYDADLTHLTGPGYYALGRDYLARAALQQAYGGGWRPLWPIRADATWDGTTLTVPFNVPVGPLVLDTVTLPDPGSYGFKAVDGSGDFPILTAALAAGNTAMAFTFTRAKSGAATLQYALTGYGMPKVLADQPRGNLRDSAPGAPNWSLHFDLAF